MDNIRKEIGYAEGFSDGQYANSERIRELKAENKALWDWRGVTVKPLVWNDYEQAQCLGMCWEMYETIPGFYNVVRCAPDAKRLGTKVTQDDAFALAQADCDRRIMSALSPAPVFVGKAALEPVDRALRHIEGCLVFPVSRQINARGYDMRTPTPETVEYMVELVVDARAALAETEGE